MQRDTKFNLIFLAIFLTACLPGAVILFRKKMQPSSRPIFMTDEVDRRVPYMAPPNTPPGYRRVIPPLTERWLADLVRERTGQPGVIAATDPRGNRQPITSGDHQVQLVANRVADGRFIADVVWWDSSLVADATRFSAELTTGSQSHPAHLDQVQQIELPKEIKAELMNLGLQTPAHIVWLQISTASYEATNPLTLTITFSNGNEKMTERISAPSGIVSR